MEEPLHTLLHHLQAPGWLSLRDALRLLLLSALFTAAASLAFPQNAGSRRVLLIAAALSLTLLPWALAQNLGVWTVALDTPPTVTLATALPNALIWAWLGIACFCLSFYLVNIVQEVRGIKRMPVIDDARLHQQMRDLCTAMQWRGTQPRVVLGNSACSLSLTGPYLILPPAWREWRVDILRSVLAHELVHIQRRDDRWLMLTRILVLLYWWMPWLRGLARHYENAMEESCDDAASELIGQPVTYAEALGAVAGAHRTRSATGMHTHQVVRRIGRFSRHRVLELDTPGVYWCLIGILVVVVGLSSVEPVQRTYEVQTPVITVASPRTRTTVLADYPNVTSWLQMPAGLSRAQRARLENPDYQPPAIYPGQALRSRQEGDVLVEFSLNMDGTVSRARVVRATPPDIFDDAALRAVHATRYGRAYNNDSASMVMRAANQNRPPNRVQRHFRFRLEQK